MGIRRDMRLRLEGSIVTAAFCAAVVTAGVLAAAPCVAASIPAWLDEAITGWNQRNPAQPFEFVSIKDSYVWYRVQRTPEIGQKEIRAAVNTLAKNNDYATTNDEELVTTGRPPSDNGPSTSKKCWKRSFVLTIQQQSNTTTVDGERSGIQQRMLTSMICEDGPYWDTGFRVSQ
jgi:hypothetical protein